VSPGNGRGGGPLWDAALDYFTAGEWPVRGHPEDGIVETGFKGEHGKWGCLAQVVGGSGRLAFYSLGPMDAGADMIAPLNELLTRANLGLVIGNFELDLDDGSFRFKTSIDVGDSIPSPGLLDGLVLANVLTMDRYLPAVQRLLYAGATVSDALADVEG
jgi:Putative bacterial sensory transduction regulator